MITAADGRRTGSAYFGSGANPSEKVTSVPVLELPTAPISSIAGFSNMRINPGWAKLSKAFPHLNPHELRPFGPRASMYSAEVRAIAYQSGVTGPGIGNSFIHPMLPRDNVYRYFNNSVSMDPRWDRNQWRNNNANDTKAFSDFWDHVFLLNDALWDDYFDQTRPARAPPAA